MEHVVLWVVVGVGAFFLSRAYDRRRTRDRRLEYFTARYADEAVAGALLEGKVWERMSEEQLRESRGPPSSMDPGPNGTAIWRYPATAGKSGARRVTLQNGRVTGWDET